MALLDSIDRSGLVAISERDRVQKISIDAFDNFGHAYVDFMTPYQVLVKNFEENLYADFWAAIEPALVARDAFLESLQNYSKTVSELRIDSSYVALNEAYPITLPSEETQLTIQQVVYEFIPNIQRLVHKAKSNISFAMIYEQIKTRHTIVKGFRNLQELIEGRLDVVDQKLDKIGTQVHGLAARVNDLAYQQDRLSAEVKEVGRSAQQASALAGAAIGLAGVASNMAQNANARSRRAVAYATFPPVR